MDKQRTLPAGLIDNDIEFFNDTKDQERCYCLTGGSAKRIPFCSALIKQMIREDMALYPVKIESLVALGYETDEAQLEKYCSCCFGHFDGNPDVKDGIFYHNEYVHCVHRGTCPVEGKLCDALQVGDGKFLTKREIEVLALVGNCDLDKEIADRLNISPETVKVHKKHICEKSGAMNKKDLIILALKKNLIQP